MTTRLPSRLQPPIGFGRQGAVDDLPRTTIEGFADALALGAGGIESDVWVTADGVPVLNPVGKVGSRLRKRRISTMNRDELPDHVPTLSEVYLAIGPACPLSLGVKEPAVFDAVVSVARAVGDEAEANLWLCHADLDQLTEWRPRTSAKLINSTGRSRVSGGIERLAAALRDRDIDGLTQFHREWSGGSIAMLHRFDRIALAWGAVHEREMAQVVDAGIDAIYSEHLDRVVAVISQYYDGAN